MKILTRQGYKDIQDCSVDEEVLYFDLYTGLEAYNEILSIEEKLPTDYPDHQEWYLINGQYTFFAQQSVWANLNVKHAFELEVGDVIYDDDDNDITIETIETFIDNEKIWYRLEISGDASFIADGITLHNASRFWVGNGNWDATTTTNWSATSGGAGGASVPVASDAVTINFVSGNCTMIAAASVASITSGAHNATFDTNDQTVTTGSTFSISGFGNRTVDLGNSAITCGTWTASTTSNLTFVMGATASITQAGGGSTFSGGSLTYTNVTIVGAGQCFITGNNNFTTLNLVPTVPDKTSATRLAADQTVSGLFTVSCGTNTGIRLLIHSSIEGTQRTISAGSLSLSKVDFQDILGAGAADWDLSAIDFGSGDCGGNTDITFTTADDWYWHYGTGNTSDYIKWYTATNSGGSRMSSNRTILAQDTMHFDADSFTAASQVFTQDMARIGAMLWDSVTNTPALTTTTACSFFGSIILCAGMTLTASTQTYTYEGTGTSILTSAGYSWAKELTINSNGGTLKLGSNYTSTTYINVNLGIFTCIDGANNYTFTVSRFITVSTADAITYLGSGTHTITGANAVSSVWLMGVNHTLYAGTSTIKFTNTAALSFSGGNKTYNNVWFAHGAGTYIIDINGNNTFNDLKDDGTEPHTIRILAASTQHFTTFTVSGVDATHRIILNSTNTGFYNFIKDGGGQVSCDYLDIYHCVASPATYTWYAGDNSVDHQATSTAGSGWIFTVPQDAPTFIPKIIFID